jgi:hypothetical protein
MRFTEELSAMRYVALFFLWTALNTCFMVPVAVIVRLFFHLTVAQTGLLSLELGALFTAILMLLRARTDRQLRVL